MCKVILRVVELHPNRVKAFVFTDFREDLEPLERDMTFKIDVRRVYDELLENINYFFKVDVSFGSINRVYSKNKELDILIGTNKITL